MRNVSVVGLAISKVNDQLKKLEERKQKLRQELFQIADFSYDEKEYLLPTTSITVDKYFLESYFDGEIGKFLKTRFPAWDMLSSTDTGTEFVVVLRKKPDYMPFSYEDELLKISRSPAETTPSLDWEVMKDYEPELFEKIARPVQTYELNEEELQKLVSEDSTVIDRLRKYAVTKAPTLRVLASTK